jgi:ribonuclease Z
MSAREVILLGTASQVPTRARGHHALFLRWDEIGVLFDPGEGTQRQMAHAGLAASQITHVCITHFQGDHCLGFAALCQAGSLAREAGARRLVLTHFSQRYGSSSAFAAEAGAHHRDVIAGDDLMVVAVPKRVAEVAG